MPSRSFDRFNIWGLFCPLSKPVHTETNKPCRVSREIRVMERISSLFCQILSPSSSLLSPSSVASVSRSCRRVCRKVGRGSRRSTHPLARRPARITGYGPCTVNTFFSYSRIITVVTVCSLKSQCHHYY